MSEQILTILKSMLDETTAMPETVNEEVRRNAVKETLQYYLLNFIYHHPEYGNWTMYGGSALRIVHGLDRMSVDLDFEVDNEIKNDFLKELKEKIIAHFINTYGAGPDFLTISVTNRRGLTLKFNIGNKLGLDFHSNQVHIKIDLNHFSAPEEIVIERWPVNDYQLSFVIKTYNLSTLMTSKIAAIFLRGKRGVGRVVYEEKGRDIYDLLWYMSKKVVPDLNYLKAKNVEEARDLRTLFDKLTIKMSNVSVDNLKQDLMPLFFNRSYIENWIANWHESYLRFLEEYKINTVTTLRNIQIHKHFGTDNFSFTFTYNTEEEQLVRIRYILSHYWIDFNEGNLTMAVDEKLEEKIEFTSDSKIADTQVPDKLKQYTTLFYNKTEKYFRKTNRVMFGDTIVTKVIRMTAGNLKPKEEILLNRSALLSSEFEDLLR